MDDETITISAKGQVIIPARIRKIFGLRKGDKLKVEIRDRSINMIPKTIDITTLVGSIKGLDIEILNEEIIRDRKDDDERGRLIKEAMMKR
jgi:AbrB family looped-hinge helix DNA binding protein